jgi:hypothetical protein
VLSLCGDVVMVRGGRAAYCVCVGVALARDEA